MVKIEKVEEGYRNCIAQGIVLEPEGGWMKIITKDKDGIVSSIRYISPHGMIITDT